MLCLFLFKQFKDNLVEQVDIAVLELERERLLGQGFKCRSGISRLCAYDDAL